jgi:hypothetical protein
MVGVAGTGVAGTVTIPADAGAPRAAGTCVADAECRLFQCCSVCSALAVDEPDPINCAAVDCTGFGCAEYSSAPVEARCVAGRCVTSVSCDERFRVEADVLPPCPAGQAHAIEPQGTAACMTAAECRSVTSCTVCQAAGLSCVVNEHGGLRPEGQFTYHCVDIPPECGSGQSCECMQTCIGVHTLCSGNGTHCAEICVNC